MTATQLYLLRHAPTEWNKNRRFQGWSDVPIHPDSEPLCLKARQEIERLSCDAVYCSTLVRTQRTAELVWPGDTSQITALEALKEIYLGSLEGMYWDEAYTSYAHVLNQWKEDPGNTRMPDGETLAEVQGRVTSAIRDIVKKHEGQKILVVSHGFALLSFLCSVLHIDLKNFRSLWLDPLGLSHVVYEKERTFVRRINHVLSS